MTSPETIQLRKPGHHNKNMQENSWEIIRANNLGAKLTRQNSTPALYFHEGTNKVYTLEGNEKSVDSPPKNLITEYRDIMLTLPQFSLNQMRRLLTNDTIEYDKT
jgi:hypothetical protein